MQGGGAYLHHQQLAAEKAEGCVQEPVPPGGDVPLGPRAARSLHSEGVAAVDSAHVPHHDPVVVGAGWETGSGGVRPSHLQAGVQGGDLLNRKFPCCSWKRRTDRDLRLARNSPYARLLRGWMSLTTPLFPPAARMLQGRAEPRSPPVISTVDQAREKNSCRGQRRPPVSCYARTCTCTCAYFVHL